MFVFFAMKYTFSKPTEVVKKITLNDYTCSEQKTLSTTYNIIPIIFINYLHCFYIFMYLKNCSLQIIITLYLSTYY